MMLHTEAACTAGHTSMRAGRLKRTSQVCQPCFVHTSMRADRHKRTSQVCQPTLALFSMYLLSLENQVERDF